MKEVRISPRGSWGWVGMSMICKPFISIQSGTGEIKHFPCLYYVELIICGTVELFHISYIISIIMSYVLNENIDH